MSSEEIMFFAHHGDMGVDQSKVKSNCFVLLVLLTFYARKIIG